MSSLRASRAALGLALVRAMPGTTIAPLPDGMTVRRRPRMEPAEHEPKFIDQDSPSRETREPCAEHSVPTLPADERLFWASLTSGSAAWDTAERAEGIWLGLFAGSWQVVDAARVAAASFVLARQVQSFEPRRPASVKHLQILERVALGAAGKSIARELSLSPGSVSLALRAMLRRMGLTSRAELLWCSRGQAELGAPPTLRVAHLDAQRGAIAVLVATVGPTTMDAPLSEPERIVALGVLEGKTHAEIAGGRERSARTVAHQFAALKKKLGASTQTEFILQSKSWAPDAPAPDRLPASLALRFAEALAAARSVGAARPLGRQE